MATLRIGFIGAGNMAQALAKGFIAAGIAKPEGIIASSPKADQHLLDEIARLNARTTYDNAEVASTSDVLVVAVKPAVVPTILADIKHIVTPAKPLITSVALGVTLASMEGVLPPGARVLRFMPNTPALVQLGASVYCRGTKSTDEDVALAYRMLSSVGRCDEVPESYLDAVTGLSGAGPAYMYLVMEALADGGVRMGLPRPLAMRLAAQTMMGAGKMILETGKHPGQLKDEVCSPGGCTIEGVSALERGGLRASLIEAVTESTKKSLEAAKKG